MTDSALTVIQLTDPHLHTDVHATLRGVQTWPSFERVLAHAKSHHWPPDVVVVTGDLAQDEASATYVKLAERMVQLNCPVLFAPGNHDNPDAMHAHLNDGALSCAPQHRFGNWQLHLLSTHVPGHVHGSLSDASLEQLRDALAQDDAPPHSLLLMHHPAFPVAPKWLNESRLDNADDLLAISRASHRVRGMVCGHVHLAFETTDQGVWMASTPSTGAQFHPSNATFSLDDRGPGYRVLRLRDDGRIESEVIWLAPEK
ncbi:MAG: metallophosphoesterase [Gammaproteobacteria bacterium]